MSAAVRLVLLARMSAIRRCLQLFLPSPNEHSSAGFFLFMFGKLLGKHFGRPGRAGRCEFYASLPQLKTRPGPQRDLPGRDESSVHFSVWVLALPERRE